MAPQLRDQSRYDIFGEHGRGGLGRVSRAHDRELGRDIAIKELISRGALSEVRFLREALITARLEHPGIVPIYEAGRWPDGTPFYAMKLVSGRPLRDLIAERKTVDERIGLLHHVIAVADAIAYAHGRNIIHRDLKPANVIVGEFGETVVIDWGLAKDLTTAEEPAAGGGPFRVHQDDGLTSAGTVLGTPGYMAPEQARGEQVDQRADVFAIGAMLWELCSLHKLPPNFSGQRRRLLRNAGIDQDLITIIEKSIDPDPARRYPNAGALAADLKAFKAGARIAARRYSVWAMLMHRARRRRAAALSIVAGLALTIGGTTLYISSVTAERDRADMSESAARHANATAKESLDELTLKHAQLLLTTDPSAAVDIVANYHGGDVDRAAQIRAEASGLGIALFRATPHTDNIFWTLGTSGGEILSLSIDGTISQTSTDGTSRVLYRGVAQLQAGKTSYASSRHLLAFACDPSNVCLFDAVHKSPPSIIAQLQSIHVSGISFSPDGRLLAIMSKEAVLWVFDVTDPTRPIQRLTKPIVGGWDVKFLDSDVIVASEPTGLTFLRLNGEAESLSFPEGSYWDANWRTHQFAQATTLGELLILESFPLRIVKRRQLCQSPIMGVRFIPTQESIAYICRDGILGIWDLQHNLARSRVQVEGHAGLIDVSLSGEYLLAAGGNGTLVVLDMYTDLVTFYKGHSFRLTSITPATNEYPFIISADARGSVRVWPLPTRIARVVTTSPSRFHTAIFHKDSSTITTSTWLSTLTSYDYSRGIRSIGPHDSANIYLKRSQDGKTFVTYGVGETIEIWSMDDASITRMRALQTGQGSISQLAFLEDSSDFITSGRDGRLVRWTSKGEATTLVHLDQPIDKLAPLGASGSIVFSTADGALWLANSDHRYRPLRPPGAQVTQIVTTADRRFLYIGYNNGDVIEIDPRSWQEKTILHSSRAIRDITVSSNGHTIAIATNDEALFVGSRDSFSTQDVAWIVLPARVSHLSLTSDGLLVAPCVNGLLWIYATFQHRWLCLSTGIVNLGWSTTADDDSAAVVLDSEGHLIWIALNDCRKVLSV